MKLHLSLLAAAAPSAHAALQTAVASPVEMVVTAHPQATDAGLKVLKAGGTAADAMVAIQAVLGVVEPQSSGMGGGAFAVYYDADSGEVTTFDARGTAPGNAAESRFMSTDAEGDAAPISFLDAWQSGLSVGVPGVPKLMETMHAKYGKLPWAELFGDAITIANEGWELAPRSEGTVNFMNSFNPPGRSACVEGDDPWFFRDPVLFDYLMEKSTDGNVTTCASKPAGTMITNPEYADLMARMQIEGAKAVYEGEVAREIVDKVAADRNPTGDATVSLEDLANYRVIERTPACVAYGKYRVCGMGPPSSGGLAVGQIFGILDHLNLRPAAMSGVHNPDNAHLFTQAMRLAFADRDLYVADSDFVDVPIDGMLDATYLAERAALVDPDIDMGTASAGTPPGVDIAEAVPQTSDDEGGTSHFGIVDQYGNALSMTSSIEGPYGAGLMVHGILLNNQLTDFSFVGGDEMGTPIANRVQANKRPRSSMSPTIVLDANNEPIFLSGTPGGPRIIGYTAQSLLSMLEFGLDPQEAAQSPHVQNRNDDTELEPPIPNVTSQYDLERLTAALVARNHTVVEAGGPTSSGLGIIAVMEDGTLVGGADPRRGYTAGGREELEGLAGEPGEPTEGDPADSAKTISIGMALLFGLLGAAVLDVS